MTQAQAADDFVGRYQGVYIDEDNSFGSQCWDLVARYAREMWQCPYFPTVSGGAEGLWRYFSDPIPKYFEKVLSTDLKKGDIVVWDKTFYPPYGHTALVFERIGPNSILVFEQDGSRDQNGDGNADGVSYLVVRSLSKVNGGLRPKGQTMEPVIDSSHEARIIAEEYGVAIAGNDPFLARAVGSTEREYRASLAPIIRNNSSVDAKTIKELEEKLAAGTGEFIESKVYIKKGQ